MGPEGAGAGGSCGVPTSSHATEQAAHPPLPPPQFKSYADIIVARVFDQQEAVAVAFEDAVGATTVKCVWGGSKAKLDH